MYLNQWIKYSDLEIFDVFTRLLIALGTFE